jgi:hypothetical protein
LASGLGFGLGLGGWEREISEEKNDDDDLNRKMFIYDVWDY